MRGSDLIQLAGDLLPRRWRHAIGPVVLAVLLLTRTLDDVVIWFVRDVAAGVAEDLTGPLAQQVEGIRSATTQP